MIARLSSAVLALALAGSAASAAPIAPLPGIEDIGPLITVQRRFGWGHPLMEPGAWREHNRQWNQRESGQPVTSCRNFRSYDPYTGTYVTKGGRRVTCPWR
jgi:hypothetical protein